MELWIGDAAKIKTKQARQFFVAFLAGGSSPSRSTM
jgi:hypothetical protein